MPGEPSRQMPRSRKLLRQAYLFVALPVAIFGIIKYVSEGEYRRLERERIRLCESKARFTVFEQVALPREHFDSDGRPTFVLFPTDNAGLGYITRTYESRLDGVATRNGPTLLEHKTQIVRVSTGEVVAERVTYWRYGGRLFSDVLAEIGGNEGAMCFGAGLSIPYALVFKPAP